MGRCSMTWWMWLIIAVLAVLAVQLPLGRAIGRRLAARQPGDLMALADATREHCACSLWDARGDRPVPVICPEVHGDDTDVISLNEWKDRVR
jgi:hypothetical protein